VLRPEIEVHNPAKVLFPRDNLTKGDLVAYYEAVADRLLAQAARRPLVLRRYPDGIDADGFVQQHASRWFSPVVGRVRVAKAGGTLEHPFCERAACLAYLAAQDTVELHAWLSRADDPGRPDRVVLDLDPGEATDLEALRAAAAAARELIAELGCGAFVTTTGSRGFHVVVPLEGPASFEATHAFARDVATLLAAADPERRCVELRRKDRRGRLFVDYLRNGYAQTAVVPYSVRARDGAPVAMPLRWEDLPSAEPQGVRLAAVLRDGLPVVDPWEGFAAAAVPIDGPAAALAERLGRTPGAPRPWGEE